jgi:hypothetical protein
MTGFLIALFEFFLGCLCCLSLERPPSSDEKSLARMARYLVARQGHWLVLCYPRHCSFDAN